MNDPFKYGTVTMSSLGYMRYKSYRDTKLNPMKGISSVYLYWT